MPPSLRCKTSSFPVSPKGNVGTFIPDQSNALIAFKTGDAKREAAARQFLTYWLGSGYAEFVTEGTKFALFDRAGLPGLIGRPRWAEPALSGDLLTKL